MRTIPFTWTAFEEMLKENCQHPYEAHPYEKHSGPLMIATVTVQARAVYGYTPGNLVRVNSDTRFHPLLEKLEWTSEGHQSLARSRTGRPTRPRGWARQNGALLLYVTDTLAVPGLIAAHLLGRPAEDALYWLVAPNNAQGIQDPVAVCRKAMPEPPLAYVMPVRSDERRPWNELDRLRVQ